METTSKARSRSKTRVKTRRTAKGVSSLQCESSERKRPPPEDSLGSLSLILTREAPLSSSAPHTQHLPYTAHVTRCAVRVCSRLGVQQPRGELQHVRLRLGVLLRPVLRGVAAAAPSVGRGRGGERSGASAAAAVRRGFAESEAVSELRRARQSELQRLPSAPSCSRACLPSQGVSPALSVALLQRCGAAAVLRERLAPPHAPLVASLLPLSPPLHSLPLQLALLCFPPQRSSHCAASCASWQPCLTRPHFRSNSSNSYLSPRSS